jgi:anaerobic magnesium-protoporphyrin IX monomethyl ester cyclase
MKVLMINPPIRIVDKHPPNFPTGIAIIASVVRNLGHNVSVLDLNSNRKTIEELNEFNFKEYNIVCIGSLVSTYKYVKGLIKIIKKNNPKTKIIIGNSLAVAGDLLMKNGADIIVYGEGEEAIQEIVLALESKLSLNKIKGISYNGKRNPSRECAKNLDIFPFPAYDLFPTEKYLKTPIDDATANPDMNMVVSRGCPYNCGYCYKNFGNKYRIRSVKNVIDEIKLLVNKYGIRAIAFVDDNFGINKIWLEEFCKKVKYLNLEWGCMTRVDSPILNKETLRKMKEAGCKSIGFGLESASQEILDKMNKGIKVKQIENAIKIVRNSGIRGDGSWMFGYPGETIKTAKETINFCYKNNLPLWWGFTTPYPETPLWEWAIKNKKINPKYLEEYICKLNDTQDFLINLTDISDEEFHKLWRYGRDKINKSPKVKFFRIVEYFKIYGVRGFLSKLKRYLSKNIKEKLQNI